MRCDQQLELSTNLREVFTVPFFLCALVESTSKNFHNYKSIKTQCSMLRVGKVLNSESAFKKAEGPSRSFLQALQNFVK